MRDWLQEAWRCSKGLARKQLQKFQTTNWILDGWRHVQPKGLWGVNRISRYTGLSYSQSEVIQHPALLTTWDNYSSRYVYKYRTKGDDSNQDFLRECFSWCGNVTFCWCTKGQSRYRPILRNMIKRWSGNFLWPLRKEMCECVGTYTGVCLEVYCLHMRV